jgi:hypothetical protein
VSLTRGDGRRESERKRKRNRKRQWQCAAPETKLFIPAKHSQQRCDDDRRPMLDSSVNRIGRPPSHAPIFNQNGTFPLNKRKVNLCLPLVEMNAVFSIYRSLPWLMALSDHHQELSGPKGRKKCVWWQKFSKCVDDGQTRPPFFKFIGTEVVSTAVLATPFATIGFTTQVVAHCTHVLCSLLSPSEIGKRRFVIQSSKCGYQSSFFLSSEVG